MGANEDSDVDKSGNFVNKWPSSIISSIESVQRKVIYRREDEMAGSLEQRLGNLEELLIIIVIIIIGGRGGHGPGPVGDSATADISRFEALRRFLPPHIIPDNFATDIARLSVEAVESGLLAVNAELTRLKAREAELNARLKELRASKTK
jgi:hypothetical protein